MTNPYEPVRLSDNPTGQPIKRFNTLTRVCVYLLLATSMLGLGVGIHSSFALAMNPPSVLGDRPFVFGLFAVIGMTGVFAYGTSMCLATIATPWKWPLNRLIEFAFLMTFISVTLVIASIASPTNSRALFFIRFTGALLSLIWHLSLALQIAMVRLDE